MVHFVDGPAKGVKLPLRRSPIMLRVVWDTCNKAWDALDQHGDIAQITEIIHVYRMSSVMGPPTTMHVNSRDPARNGWFVEAHYDYYGEVFDRYIRKNSAWAKWCNENRETLLTPELRQLIKDSQ